VDKDQRELAEFYARLASIRSLESLREAERILLREDLQTLLWRQFSPLTTKDFIKQARADERKRRKGEAPGPIGQDLQALPLEREHQWAREVIAGLLDGKSVTEPPITLPLKVLRLTPEGKLGERPYHSIPDAREMLVFKLSQLLRHKPFPFRRCPVCQAVFVPVKRQRYCSPFCMSRGIGDTKKVQKREYMRTYMAKRRKNAKQKARRGRKEK